MFDFGMNLRELREKKQMTQRRLADILEISVSTVSKYEGNLMMPPLETLRTLSTVFGVSMDALCGMQKTSDIAVIGLTADQIDLLKSFRDFLREKNASLLSLSQESKYNMLGRMTLEIMK